MQTPCQECGHPNELGHLFCIKCGIRLELQNIDEDIEASIETERRFLAVKLFVMLIVLLIVGFLGTALWPGAAFDKDNIGNGFDTLVEQNVTTMSLISARTGATMTTPAPLEQLDINAWFAGRGDGSHSAKSVSVKLEKGKFTCRMICSVGPWMVKDVKIPEIPFSFDLVGKPENGKLNISGAKIGHMPLVGPLVGMLAEQLDKKLFVKADRGRKIFANATDIQIEDGKVTITVVGK